MSQSTQLMGGAAVQKDFGGNEQWVHTTARNQRMWVSDQNGKDIGERDVYSPFGEQLVTTSQVPSDSKVPNLQWQAGMGIESQSLGSVTTIEMGARLEDIAGTIHAHPTLGEAVQETALRALGHALHI